MSVQPITVVFLPGWLIPLSLYKHFLAQLPHYFRVQILDLPKMPDPTQALTELKQQISHPPQLIIGHSLGGMWALALAQHFDDPAVFCICTNPKFTSDTDWLGTDLSELERLEQHFITHPDRALTVFQRLLSLGEDHETINTLKSTLTQSNDKQQIGLLHLKLLDVRPHLKNNQAFWLAQHDAFVPHQIANHLPENVDCFQSTQGHLPFLSQPKTLAHTIAQWFSRIN